MTSEHDFCFSIFITLLWLYLCLAVWVKLVNHDTMLKVTHATWYHFNIKIHPYNGNTNIPTLESRKGGSRSAHWASPAWRGLLQFLSLCICLIILTFLLTPDPPACPPYFHADNLFQTKTLVSCRWAQVTALLTEDSRLTGAGAPKVARDKIILRSRYSDRFMKAETNRWCPLIPRYLSPCSRWYLNVTEINPLMTLGSLSDNTHHHHLPAPALANPGLKFYLLYG